MEKYKITVIGSGNVATHLAKNFYQLGHKILQIYSRQEFNARTLAGVVAAQAITRLCEVNENADIIIVAVKDNVIGQVVHQLEVDGAMVVHTAGSIDMKSLDKFKNHGVLYPLQTFSKTIDLQTKIPFCLEANSAQNLQKLQQLALSVSDAVYVLNSEQRKQCHLAAVFACNFTNYMYQVAHEMLAEKQIPFALMQPLIQETAKKVMKISPQQAQTGPAFRNDQKVIQQHLDALNNEHYKKLYSFVSDSIIDSNNSNTELKIYPFE